MSNYFLSLELTVQRGGTRVYPGRHMHSAKAVSPMQ